MRNTVEINVWMKRNGLSVAKIQKELGYKTHTGVSKTLAGRGSLRRVLELLSKKGCPAEYLDMHKTMKG